MVTHLARCAHRLAGVTAPLKDVLKKDNIFRRDGQLDKAFQHMKELITREPDQIDSRKEVTLQVDSSKRGLGDTLMQAGKPVADASKS